MDFKQNPVITPEVTVKNSDTNVDSISWKSRILIATQTESVDSKLLYLPNEQLYFAHTLRQSVSNIAFFCFRHKNTSLRKVIGANTLKAIRLLTELPLIGLLVKRIVKSKANDEAASIATHFGHFFEPLVALDASMRDEAMRIRHEVYCRELNFEPLRPDGKETDEFDHYSIMCLIKHKARTDFAGTVRLVRPTMATQQLPIEKYCKHAMAGSSKHPDQFERTKVCEISRLAVPAGYRRRQADQYQGAATGVINETTYSEEELRCFPFIAIGLYLSAAALCHELGIENVFVMMEPRLARSMRFVGINFEQLGPAVEYHGKRAPYYIKPKELLSSLSPGFLHLLKNIDRHLDSQIKKGIASGAIH
ncbi:PEP-CTERM/exosortase system-associated acyltransferase [Aliiglaciecola sp. CAU 1673]|uniref:PEP-CTERM/exosortase system-associated acyltransferase n=1 Tax=Aliiglaciecola sp. CAU 1673 TaxID=3032595 RepID=UPI0023DA087C|nr:PEP-CTERM/exosortase system-associated acyltransferase [Aliiglaciecola sp. CAU 1673]MDF2177319.1 PEP-CTERM/exosortase system-associated acyltransferase [Aliiglaciecola sp. CAU 1673]